jgi:hypothetical protein
MHGLFFYIGLGAGLAVAAGLRPFLPALLAGGLGSGDALGVDFQHGGYTFLQQGWWLIAMAALLAAAWLAQLRLGSERLESGPIGAAVAGVAIGVGALLFAGTLSDHGDAAWPGLIAGAGAAALSAAAVRPLFARARGRLTDAASRQALTLYLDGAALVITAAVALLHPLGYVAVAALAWLLLASRRRAGEKYAGLRILRG